MDTRKHVHQETFPVSVERLFAILHTPTAIRAWWGAARVIVLPKRGGAWAATWGESEDEPDYTTIATIRDFDAPNRMVLSDYRYYSKSGPLPFEANFLTEFAVSRHPEGALLRVTQDGFPATVDADDFYAGCKKGWSDTFAGIRKYLGDAETGA